ncbi:photosystem II 5 kDa protein, chloroplastic [Amaranthus tricolor]|uniref:photosystem II 5 kDa protein, chloroplastic n=1 Tax=Amaranthus tricolor TaxID=29722 RepID=UPI00258F31F6|nr:photosystem II 5 kDa protein, chloroplastic [Amaranthus tricolor]
MASITTTASFLGAASALKQFSTPSRRGVVMSKAVQAPEAEYTTKEETNPKRRDLLFAAAAVAICSVGNVAMADEPQRGTEEAKKKYAPICVTMPTARICHK